MAAKKKKVKAKNVDHKSSEGMIAKEVLVDAPDEEAEPTPVPAIKEEAVMKVVEKGHAVYYTESEYRKKYGKKDA